MSETTTNEQVKSHAKLKKGITIAVNILVGLILVLVLFISVCVISSRGKGYTAFFGRAFVAVESNSMVGSGDDNFERGDLVIFDELSDAEKATLEVGQIITFYDTINGERALNTHRLVEVRFDNETGELSSVITQGDANPTADPVHLAEDVVGRYVGQVKGLGNFVLFFNSQWGFFTCIVLPAFIVVAVCVLNLVKAIRDNRALKVQESDAEKEARIKAELLAQLAEQGIIPPKDPDAEPKDLDEASEDKKD